MEQFLKEKEKIIARMELRLKENNNKKPLPLPKGDLLDEMLG